MVCAHDSWVHAFWTVILIPARPAVQRSPVDLSSNGILQSMNQRVRDGITELDLCPRWLQVFIPTGWVAAPGPPHRGELVDAQKAIYLLQSGSILLSSCSLDRPGKRWPTTGEVLGP